MSITQIDLAEQIRKYAGTHPKSATRNVYDTSVHHSNSLPIIFIDDRSRVLYATEECARVTGYRCREFYSTHFHFLSIVSPEFRTLVNSYFNKHIRGEDFQPFPHRIVTKVGKSIEAILSRQMYWKLWCQGHLNVDSQWEKALWVIIT